MSDIEKALAFFQGISSQDSTLATKYIDPEHYLKHNPHARDGVEGAKQYVDQIVTDHPELKVIRACQDGPTSSRRRMGLFSATAPFSTCSSSRAA